MAVIKNQKTGMWEVRTYYKDWTGERKQKTKRGFAKKSEALEWERNFKLKEDQSISMTFGSFVEIYLKDLESRIKKNTFLTKKHIIETKILPYFGRRKLDEIRTCDVIQWQNEMMKLTKDNGELFSPTYLKTIHNQLSAILNHAVNFYGLKDNVARKAGNMGKEADKWRKVSDIAKQETEYAQFELAEAERLKKELLGVVDGDSYLKEQVIELRYQNHVLKEENKTLKDKLEKAYEFMKQFVIGGMNLLEKFMDWIGEKVRDVGRGR